MTVWLEVDDPLAGLFDDWMQLNWLGCRADLRAMGVVEGSRLLVNSLGEIVLS